MLTLPPTALPRTIVGLISLVMVPLLGMICLLALTGCGGGSPEARATQTTVALYGTNTPTAWEEASAAIAEGTLTGFDPTIVAELTAEASLTIATPEPRPAGEAALNSKLP